MRKIEQDAIAACRRGRSWSKGHDKVVVHGDNLLEYKLWGNTIAHIMPDWEFITVFDGGHRSTTTKSRLNALLKAFTCSGGIYQKNSVWYNANGDVFENGTTYQITTQ